MSPSTGKTVPARTVSEPCKCKRDCLKLLQRANNHQCWSHSTTRLAPVWAHHFPPGQWQNCTSKDCEWTLQVQVIVQNFYREWTIISAGVIQLQDSHLFGLITSLLVKWHRPRQVTEIRDRLPTLTVSAGRYCDITAILRFCWNSISVSQKFVVDIL